MTSYKPSEHGYIETYESAYGLGQVWYYKRPVYSLDQQRRIDPAGLNIKNQDSVKLAKMINTFSISWRLAAGRY